MIEILPLIFKLTRWFKLPYVLNERVINGSSGDSVDNINMVKCSQYFLNVSMFYVQIDCFHDPVKYGIDAVLLKVSKTRLALWAGR